MTTSSATITTLGDWGLDLRVRGVHADPSDRGVLVAYARQQPAGWRIRQRPDGRHEQWWPTRDDAHAVLTALGARATAPAMPLGITIDDDEWDDYASPVPSPGQLNHGDASTQAGSRG